VSAHHFLPSRSRGPYRVSAARFETIMRFAHQHLDHVHWRGRKHFDLRTFDIHFEDVHRLDPVSRNDIGHREAIDRKSMIQFTAMLSERIFDHAEGPRLCIGIDDADSSSMTPKRATY